MLEPLNAVLGGGSNVLHDAIAWPTEVMSHGWAIADQWHFQMNSFFDGVPTKDTYAYANYNLLDEITYSLFAVDTNSNS